MEDERMKFLTLEPLDGWENQKPSQIMEKMGTNSPYSSKEQEEHEWRNGSGRGGRDKRG